MAVYYAVEAAFSTLTADGSATATTTKLTLTFNKDITGLSANDITLTANGTGAAKGALTAKGSGVYELALSGITASGPVTVGVTKSGYAITPASKDVAVYYTVKQNIGVTFGGGPQAENLGNLGNPAASISWSGSDSLTAAVSASAGTWANGADFAWYMDSAIISGQTNASITINARNYVPGSHTLAVKATKGGISYSKTVVFTITE